MKRDNINKNEVLKIGCSTKCKYFYRKALRRFARKKGYHGVTVASAIMTGLPNQNKLFDLPKEHFIHTETPNYFKERN